MNEERNGSLPQPKGCVDAVDVNLRPDGCLILDGYLPLNLPLIPVKELPRRRKVVWVWVCCICGLGGMKVAVVSCPNCGIGRCPNCETRRYPIRELQASEATRTTRFLFLHFQESI
ncbi:hypothetical protein FocnCong_v018098 [Fusarium oxysporum f. sp. conglutinans]|nr:hypothetical protein FocnCong_v018098 [Fusarium oxysporum f. sp. conglutinans]